MSTTHREVKVSTTTGTPLSTWYGARLTIGLPASTAPSPGQATSDSAKWLCRTSRVPHYKQARGFEEQPQHFVETGFQLKSSCDLTDGDYSTIMARSADYNGGLTSLTDALTVEGYRSMTHNGDVDSPDVIPMIWCQCAQTRHLRS